MVGLPQGTKMNLTEKNSAPTKESGKEKGLGERRREGTKVGNSSNNKIIEKKGHWDTGSYSEKSYQRELKKRSIPKEQAAEQGN